MIGRLSGILIESRPPELLIDVGGVGYDVYAPMTTCYQLPKLADKIALYTHLAINENTHTLFGFISEKDRFFFRLLIKVSGVGPKMAIGVMSMETDDVVRYIKEESVSALLQLPGVGKKTAERLIIEMRDKLKVWQTPNPQIDLNTAIDETVEKENVASIIADAESALLSLGYKPLEASKAISRVYSEEIKRSEDLIRLALRAMLPG